MLERTDVAVIQIIDVTQLNLIFIHCHEIRIFVDIIIQPNYSMLYFRVIKKFQL